MGDRMTYTVTVKMKKEVTLLKAAMGVRYWEDGIVNGKADSEDCPTMPFAANGIWRLVIDIATGKILEWPHGVTASTHYKVCDDGVYSLIDSNGDTVAEKDGYVPRMLSPKKDGFGDYAIMDIGEDGQICGWKPDLSYFEDDDQ